MESWFHLIGVSLDFSLAGPHGMWVPFMGHIEIKGLYEQPETVKELEVSIKN